MKTTFARLFEVRVRHDYRHSGKNVDFACEPTLGCATELARHGLHFRVLDTGFAVFGELDGEGPALRRPLGDGIVLRFWMRARTDEATRVTDLDGDASRWRPGSCILVFANEQALDVGGGERSLCSAGDRASTADLVALRPLRFTLRRDTDLVVPHLRVMDSRGLTVIDETVRPLRAGAGATGRVEHAVDLSGFGEGEYRLRFEGTAEDVFHGSDERTPDTAVGLIEISHDGTIPIDARIQTSGGAPTGRRFQVRFGARSARWRYVVSRKRPMEADELTVSGPSTALSFGNSELVRDDLASSERIERFAASQPTPFVDQPVRGISLRRTVIVDGLPVTVDLRTNLPSPSPAAIVTAEGEAFADTYVFL
ncbi:MAG: hypothetical protein HZB39_18230 [Planctomycetes bacterium]|nr:hypothetical protein [Planctomycetota bacterium]